jgi:D-threo-aldose 1-dehydrogenase
MMTAHLSPGVFDAVLCHNRYILIYQTAESLSRDARQCGMTVFNAAPFAQNSLRSARTGRTIRIPARSRRTQRLGFEGGAMHGARNVPPVAAVAFSLWSPLIESTVAGISKRGRLAELALMVAQEVPDQFWVELAHLDTPPSAR